jgi:type VI secretion system protein ImpL
VPPGNGPALRADGPWALLRLFDSARLQPAAQADRFRLDFDSDGRQAQLELQASSVANPFRRAALEQFRCPDRL